MTRSGSHGAPARRRGAPAYSRFVAAMKMTLPSLAVVLVTVVVVWPQLAAQGDDGFALGFADLSVEAKSERMVNPRYYGTDADEQPFTITADLAQEDESDAEKVKLAVPTADMTNEDGSWIMLGAREGVYDKTRQVLDLAGDVKMFHDGGYELHTAELSIRMEEGQAEGHTAVAGQGPFGTIQSEGLRITEKGDRVVFTGRARLILREGVGDNIRQTRRD